MLLPRRPVPELRVPTLAHGEFDLAADAPKLFTLICFYRGLHCPVCLKYLRELESLIPEYERRGTKVIAISSDVRERAQEMANKVGASLRSRIFTAAGGCSQVGSLYFVVAWKDIDQHRRAVTVFGARRIPRPTGWYFVLRRGSNNAVRTSVVLGIASSDRFRYRRDYPARGEYDGPL